MIIERFCRAGEVDAIGIAAGTVGHDPDEAARIVRPEILRKFFSDNAKVIGGDGRCTCVMGAERSQKGNRLSVDGLDRKKGDRAIHIRSFTNFVGCIVTWIHGHDIAISS